MAWLSTNIVATGSSSITYATSGLPLTKVNVNVSIAIAAGKYYYCCYDNNYRRCGTGTSSTSIYPTKLWSSWGGRRRKATVIRAEAETPAPIPMATSTVEKSGIKIIHNPPDSTLSELAVRTWPKWGCPPSKFPWTYSSKETCYVLKGKVKVYPDGSDEVVEIGAGDLVEFPKGMSCTWDVSEAVDKHYNFD